MKLFEKVCVDEKTRIIRVFNLPFEYKKSVDEKNNILYDVKVLNFKFSITKKRKKKNKKFVQNTCSDKIIKTDSLIYARCIRNLFEKVDNIETMCIGSSTARCGFIEDEISVNMGIDAQDLYYSYQILKKYITVIPNLKNIVLYWDVFSSGNDLDRHPEKHRRAFYKVFYDIPYRNSLCAYKDNSVALEKKIRYFMKHTLKALKDVPKDYSPPLSGGLYTKEEMVLWAENELKLYKRNQFLHYLKFIIKECKNSNLNLFIVTMPRNPVVKQCYPNSSELFSSLYDIIKINPEVKIINAFDEIEFKETDFADLLHLKYSGAKLLTDYVKSFYTK